MLDHLSNIVHHGGVDGVTGSCHEWQFSHSSSILIDCGLFQGKDQQDHDLNFNFDISHIQALILTHCHIDHVGRLPWLIAAGYRGPIYCSVPTASLLPLILEDALQIQIPGQNPLITQTITRIRRQLVPLEYCEPFEFKNEFNDSIQICLQNAGHILGSAYVELTYRDRTTVFSGDLGTGGSYINPELVSPLKANELVLESTYGDRQHQKQLSRKDQLKDIIMRSLKDGGPIIIPAFSLGRTQEILATISDIKADANLSDDIEEAWEGQKLPVILDSPLASKITYAYRRLRPYWNENLVTKNPFSFKSFATVQNYQEHKTVIRHLANTKKPAIIIAASGMCQGGRVMDYLEAFMGEPETDIVFVGYQAEGTLGRAIIEGYQGAIHLVNKKPIAAHARIHQISGFSAHADQQELLAFIRNIPQPPEFIRLVHGESGSKRILKQKIEAEFTSTQVLV